MTGKRDGIVDCCDWEWELSIVVTGDWDGIVDCCDWEWDGIVDC